ncbi:unnamed protein product [Fusarium graminearum]|uniref:Chromosome 2, complete genome n=2 Tax=Gibberella zeae TaxID=5518 RepID=I1S8T2_GIBZE|nr:hypothetical protein FGSG_13260 [Fusarium graminearum PH-1]CAF3433387.1 unnamed protein product [Fusarium graminearum]ESU14311.1 hypothetical protein FGSG_13260 [Fusarium graminearum PH-1]CAF3666086.1 unnamed protein product [Fusarium graminearum]CAG1960087.1 unnamed protein product [Fusarium graminearum]CEF77442.1 unnamed protein product [Fusarium graminearum]|eukprot:XP_011319736.1 hypothetical protein FGSG_13260 [Fusarium graminearum PH-1]
MAYLTTLEARLDAVYSALETLGPDSLAEDFVNFASFFSEDCIAYLRGMRDHKTPAFGRQGLIHDLQNLLQSQHLKKRRVISQVANEQGGQIFSEMENQYIVHSEILDPFHKTAVVSFNREGLIHSFKLYCCRSHFVWLTQQATGEGSYKDLTV